MSTSVIGKDGGTLEENYDTNGNVWFGDSLRDYNSLSEYISEYTSETSYQRYPSKYKTDQEDNWEKDLKEIFNETKHRSTESEYENNSEIIGQHIKGSANVYPNLKGSILSDDFESKINSTLTISDHGINKVLTDISGLPTVRFMVFTKEPSYQKVKGHDVTIINFRMAIIFVKGGSQEFRPHKDDQSNSSLVTMSLTGFRNCQWDWVSEDLYTTIGDGVSTNTGGRQYLKPVDINNPDTTGWGYSGSNGDIEIGPASDFKVPTLGQTVGALDLCRIFYFKDSGSYVGGSLSEEIDSNRLVITDPNRKVLRQLAPGQSLLIGGNYIMPNTSNRRNYTKTLGVRLSPLVKGRWYKDTHCYRLNQDGTFRAKEVSYEPSTDYSFGIKPIINTRISCINKSLRSPIYFNSPKSWNGYTAPTDLSVSISTNINTLPHNVQTSGMNSPRYYIRLLRDNSHSWTNSLDSYNSLGNKRSSLTKIDSISTLSLKQNPYTDLSFQAVIFKDLDWRFPEGQDPLPINLGGEEKPEFRSYTAFVNFEIPHKAFKLRNSPLTYFQLGNGSNIKQLSDGRRYLLYGETLIDNEGNEVNNNDNLLGNGVLSYADVTSGGKYLNPPSSPELSPNLIGNPSSEHISADYIGISGELDNSSGFKYKTLTFKFSDATGHLSDDNFQDSDPVTAGEIYIRLNPYTNCWYYHHKINPEDSGHINSPVTYGEVVAVSASGGTPAPADPLSLMKVVWSNGSSGDEYTTWVAGSQVDNGATFKVREVCTGYIDSEERGSDPSEYLVVFRCPRNVAPLTVGDSANGVNLCYGDSRGNSNTNYRNFSRAEGSYLVKQYLYNCLDHPELSYNFNALLGSLDLGYFNSYDVELYRVSARHLDKGTGLFKSDENPTEFNYDGSGFYDKISKTSDNNINFTDSFYSNFDVKGMVESRRLVTGYYRLKFTAKCSVDGQVYDNPQEPGIRNNIDYEKYKGTNISITDNFLIGAPPESPEIVVPNCSNGTVETCNLNPGILFKVRNPDYLTLDDSRISKVVVRVRGGVDHTGCINYRSDLTPYFTDESDECFKTIRYSNEDYVEYYQDSTDSHPLVRGLVPDDSYAFQLNGSLFTPEVSYGGTVSSNEDPAFHINSTGNIRVYRYPRSNHSSGPWTVKSNELLIAIECPEISKTPDSVTSVEVEVYNDFNLSSSTSFNYIYRQISRSETEDIVKYSDNNSTTIQDLLERAKYKLTEYSNIYVPLRSFDTHVQNANYSNVNNDLYHTYVKSNKIESNPSLNTFLEDSYLTLDRIFCNLHYWTHFLPGTRKVLISNVVGEGSVTINRSIYLTKTRSLAEEVTFIKKGDRWEVDVPKEDDTREVYTDFNSLGITCDDSITKFTVKTENSLGDSSPGWKSRYVNRGLIGTFNKGEDNSLLRVRGKGTDPEEDDYYDGNLLGYIYDLLEYFL